MSMRRLLLFRLADGFGKISGGAGAERKEGKGRAESGMENRERQGNREKFNLGWRCRVSFVYPAEATMEIIRIEIHLPLSLPLACNFLCVFVRSIDSLEEI